MDPTPTEFNIRIAGEAGQGIETFGSALCHIYKKSGFHIFANQDYMSRIRGGNNYFQIRVSEAEIFSCREKIDILVALDLPSISLHQSNLHKNGIILLDKAKFNMTQNEPNYFDIPLFALAQKMGGSELYVNSIMCGIMAYITSAELSLLLKTTRIIFKDKTEEIINKNILAVKAGFDFAQNYYKGKLFKINPSVTIPHLLMNGNDAIALGAIKAGCKFYSAYPMSPSTSIMTVVAHYAKKFNIIVEQAEDEIAAVNMVIGASFAGVRSMTATSGGGFALMAEGVSLAAMTETPLVIVDAQRPAPATGLPTRTEQADLNFLIHAGHGEFAKIILAPGTIEEAFTLTIRAFELAEQYQIPVFILTDQHLADSYKDIDNLEGRNQKMVRHIISKNESINLLNYKRYQMTETGISPRAIPSWISQPIYVDSDEHTEEGHITEDADIRRKMVEKRLYLKNKGLRNEILKQKAFQLENADLILLGFGSTFGVMKEACEKISNHRVGFIHLSQVWPFPTDEILEYLKGAKKIYTIENNATGQLAGIIRQETTLKIHGSILKFDGRPFNLDLVIEIINKAFNK
ncbi:MAG: 2-oxoacid:acceptor oxidoreductase subunit alpha [Candidatus Omnitrophica bacterium]|nr:2-oxoacid:acceptor oxidoreductase subunit alpha [Candidatus Omnitrophota bacterium]